ncbi:MULTISPECIES: Dethiobiotin synthetase [unclassified Coleofasciculus]|uniref:Dethiobiotin synthetase n=1 Tax=unclassified Coleofasciculus TaxID=2692782 RepID=UPI00187FDE76|nr:MULTISPECIES: Dethiobiotin synthetase [unclassified Coleofasciculus]MBE9126386.1 Dethiobiotin synthetase [Coleofasciculus sp. LEGE 07081]MBE9149835.1 Dethiobiotin synthetase [Coleofasciculus sp. LEGE 07092]
MDYKTARSFIISQGTAPDQNNDGFLVRLKQGKAPIPGQVTNILLALKMVFEGLRGSTTIDRELIYSLYLISYESRERFEAGRQTGVNWPPLLDEDLKRIARTVKSIFAGVWYNH